MGQALYRKYRSKSLDEIVGQEHITTALAQALKSDRISHAYLFTGPRGVGKTSIARIMAHAINDLPYEKGVNHLDIIEIDAASNRRIDEIRDLRDRVYVAPANARYKVYIIDEVHMLTKEAFNALLKTLEEPPAHVVFILATTEVHKLPATIVSRTQRYIFKPVEQRKVIEHLRTISKQEGVTIDDDALALLAEHGEGSFRDSISLLDQAANSDQAVTGDMVRSMLGVAPAESVQQLITALEQNDKSAVVTTLKSMAEQGYAAPQISNQLAEQLRAAYLQSSLQIDDEATLDLLAALVEVPASADPARLLEISLLKAIKQPLTVAAPIALQAVTPATVPAPPAALTPKPASKPEPTPPKTKAAPVEPAIIEPKLMSAPEPAIVPAGAATATDFDIAVWPQVVEAARSRYNTLHSILKTAQPVIEDGSLKLCVKFAFHQKRMSETKNKQIIGDLIKSVTGLDVAFDCVTGIDDAKPAVAQTTPTIAAPPKTEAPLSAISDIFGGGEVVN